LGLRNQYRFQFASHDNIKLVFHGCIEKRCEKRMSLNVYVLIIMLLVTLIYLAFKLFKKYG
jgi:hypothetical protein